MSASIRGSILMPDGPVVRGVDYPVVQGVNTIQLGVIKPRADVGFTLCPHTRGDEPVTPTRLYEVSVSMLTEEHAMDPARLDCRAKPVLHLPVGVGSRRSPFYPEPADNEDEGLWVLQPGERKEDPKTTMFARADERCVVLTFHNPNSVPVHVFVLGFFRPVAEVP